MKQPKSFPCFLGEIVFCKPEEPFDHSELFSKLVSYYGSHIEKYREQLKQDLLNPEVRECTVLQLPIELCIETLTDLANYFEAVYVFKIAERVWKP